MKQATAERISTLFGLFFSCRRKFDFEKYFELVIGLRVFENMKLFSDKFVIKIW